MNLRVGGTAVKFQFLNFLFFNRWISTFNILDSHWY